MADRVASRTRTRALYAYVALGLALVVVYHWVDPWGLGYTVIGVYGGGGALVGALRQRGAARRPWLAFACGVLLMVVGDLVWNIQSRVGEFGPPLLSDAIYVAAYPLLALGLLLLSRMLTDDGDGSLVDTLIVALSFATMLWPLLFASFIEGGDAIEQIMVGTYPCFDLVLLAFAVRIALSRTMHTQRTLLLVASIALFLTGDVFWFESVNTYALGNWEDFLWLTAYVFFGAAAMHPSPLDAERPEVTPFRRFALLAIPVTLLPAADVIEMARDRTTTYVDGGLMSVILLLLLIRFGSVLRGLDTAQSELREQNRLKDELISVVSHDLRTPLTSIMGYLELALDEGIDRAEGKQYLEVVQRNTGRLHRLVEDLLFVSRVQSGKESLDLEPVDLGELARHAVDQALPAAEAAEVKLAWDVDCTEVVLADEHRLAEVLENLLSNALKFTPPGGRAHVSVESDGDDVVIRVSDTGVGIAEEDRRHLFDRFFRASGTDGIPGAGLGLSIVKAIVDAHCGRIGVESTVGAGTTFEVRLPRVVAPAEAVAA